jgi:acetyl-CoA acetyltransferase
MPKTTSPDELERLKAEVARLTAELAVANTANEDAARRAMFFKDVNEEVPTGETVEVDRCTKYETVGYRDDGRPILKPVFKKVKLPTFLYKVDMPPVGGVDIKVNGESFFHGETYTLDLDQLRVVKEIVHRIRDHEATIHGTDENAYRPKVNARFSGKTGGRVH